MKRLKRFFINEAEALEFKNSLEQNQVGFIVPIRDEELYIKHDTLLLLGYNVFYNELI